MRKTRPQSNWEDLVEWPAVELRHLPAVETPHFQEKIVRCRGKGSGGKKINKHWMLSKCRLNEATGCWEWGWYVANSGYGTSFIKNKAQIATHRLAYMLWKGPIPDDLWVLHKCDNRLCCNPNHLFLGTHLDNVEDAKLKNRYSKIFQGNKTKLSDSQVKEIRSSPLSMKALAKLFGVCPPTIKNVLSQRCYKWVK